MSDTRIVLRTIQLVLIGASLIAPANAEDKPKQTFAGLISVTDPDKDCELRLTGDKLQIHVPPQNHNLHPTRGLNAPRVLKKVAGDFTVQVKVTANFQPGPISTKRPNQGRPFNGAGLLIWQSEENFLRFERNAYWVEQTLYCYPPLIEYFHNRADAGFNNAPTDVPYFMGRSTWLKAQRIGKEITVSISHDGEQWTEVKTFPVEMDNELSVGVAAINSSNKPFTVEFDEFSIQSE